MTQERALIVSLTDGWEPLQSPLPVCTCVNAGRVTLNHPEMPLSLSGRAGRLLGQSRRSGACRAMSSRLQAERSSREADGRPSPEHLGALAHWVGVALLLKPIYLKYP